MNVSITINVVERSVFGRECLLISKKFWFVKFEIFFFNYFKYNLIVFVLFVLFKKP